MLKERQGRTEMDLSKNTLRTLYEDMVMIRKAENAFQKEFMAGNIPGFIHLYLGEEAIAAAVCGQLRRDDYVTSTHRGHGHFIAKGSDLNKIAAELMGKSTGLCRGRGGSMHMTDMEHGMLGTTGIVGGGFPMAAGLGFAFQKMGTDQVSVCFFGDGSVNEGTFHEAVNLAAIWDLPVLFVCENNLYAQSTPQEYHQKVKDIAKRAEGYGIPGESVDGMDVFAVHEAAGRAIRRARSGLGPTLLECKTYLYSGHYVGDAKGYRLPEEMEHYREKRDCIRLFTEKALREGLLEQEELDEISSSVEEKVRAAVEFAAESPLPDPQEVAEFVYGSY